MTFQSIKSEFKYLQLNDPLVRLLLVLFNTITVKQAPRVAGRPSELEYRGELTRYKLYPQAQVLLCSLNSFLSEVLVYTELPEKGDRVVAFYFSLPCGWIFPGQKTHSFQRFSSPWQRPRPTCLSAKMQSTAVHAVKRLPLQEGWGSS